MSDEASAKLTRLKIEAMDEADAAMETMRGWGEALKNGTPGAEDSIRTFARATATFFLIDVPSKLVNKAEARRLFEQQIRTIHTNAGEMGPRIADILEKEYEIKRAALEKEAEES